MSDIITSHYVIDAVIRAIVAEDPTIPVYDENQKQDTETPCYHVSTGRLTFLTQISATACYNVPVIIRYEPPLKDPGKAAKCRYIAQQLFTTLTKIEAHSLPLRGVDMSYDIVDEMLIFNVTYNVKGASLATGTNMEIIEQHVTKE